jgi:hypothetical protein
LFTVNEIYSTLALLVVVNVRSTPIKYHANQGNIRVMLGEVPLHCNREIGTFSYNRSYIGTNRNRIGALKNRFLFGNLAERVKWACTNSGLFYEASTWREYHMT